MFLTYFEMKLLKYYRESDERGKRAILNTACFEFDETQTEKKQEVNIPRPPLCNTGSENT